MTDSKPQDPTIRVPLTPVEAELVRRVEADYRQAVAAAQAERKRAIDLVITAHGADGVQWSLSSQPDGSIVLVLPAPSGEGEAGQVERRLELVPGGAGEGNGTASEDVVKAGGAEAS